MSNLWDDDDDTTTTGQVGAIDQDHDQDQEAAPPLTAPAGRPFLEAEPMPNTLPTPARVVEPGGEARAFVRRLLLPPDEQERAAIEAELSGALELHDLGPALARVQEARDELVQVIEASAREREEAGALIDRARSKLVEAEASADPTAIATALERVDEARRAYDVAARVARSRIAKARELVDQARAAAAGEVGRAADHDQEQRDVAAARLRVAIRAQEQRLVLLRDAKPWTGAFGEPAWGARHVHEDGSVTWTRMSVTYPAHTGRIDAPPPAERHGLAPGRTEARADRELHAWGDNA